jgi:hypothetical protein
MGCVFQSTEEKHVTKVDWMFSSGQHAEVTWRKCHCGGIEADGWWCQDRLGQRYYKSLGFGGIIIRPLPHSDTWLCNQQSCWMSASWVVKKKAMLDFQVVEGPMRDMHMKPF